MSTFIYQNDILYADTRKLLTLPDGDFIGAVYESKVVKAPFGYYAHSGGVLNELWYCVAMNYVTIVESVEYVIRVVEEALPNGEGDKFVDDLWLVKEAVMDWFRNLAKEKTFLIATKRHIYVTVPFRNINGIRVESLDAPTTAGAAAYCAKMMVTRGIPPIEVYPLLRKSGAPTGETCEIHKLSDLPDLAPPWLNHRVWGAIYNSWKYEKGIDADHSKSLENVDMVKLCYTVATMGKFKRGMNYPDVQRIRNIASKW